MSLIQGLGLLGSCGELAGTLAHEAATVAETLPLASAVFDGARELRGLTQEVGPRLFPTIFSGAGRLAERYNQAMATWRRTSLYLESVLSRYPHLQRHPQWLTLMDIVTGPTSADAEGFPQLIPVTYNLFRDQVPHLFRDGLAVLDWLNDVEGVLAHRPDIDTEARESIRRGVKAVRTMTLTAAVTAPSDLWLVRQIVGVHRELGTLDRLEAGEMIDPETYAESHGLDPRQLGYDLEFLHSRGYFDKTEKGFALTNPDAARVLDRIGPLPKDFRRDMVSELTARLKDPSDTERNLRIDAWYGLRASVAAIEGWTAGSQEIDLGYHLMPTVLALKAAGLTAGVKKGQPLSLPKSPSVAMNVERLLQEAGIVRRGVVTEWGERVLERGPGAFGIIGAYHTYLNQHEGLLRAKGERPWVERGPNIFASRDANRKSFQDAVATHARYMEATGDRPSVVIEHALGLGVAVQEFVKMHGSAGFRFIGADYEDAALERAKAERAAGRLPDNMDFIQADIGLPEKLIRFIRSQGLATEQAVMIVGNGFHEVRNQTDERMIKVFEAYREAGIRLIFVEESGLTTEQLLKSAWNSYHAGFRWVHQTSGQGLRTPWPTGEARARLSWSECAERAGYQVLPDYTKGTRPLLPLELPPNQNPQISVTYFCVPQTH